MSNFSAQSPMDSGYPNALTLPVSTLLYSKRTFAGSLSTHTVCCSEHRARADQFTRRAIHQRGQRLSRAIPTPAARSGVRTKVILAIQLTGNSIATSVSTYLWNIWDRSRAERENSPA